MEDVVRRIALALPEATERETFGGPTFRVREKIFTMLQNVKGRPSVWTKAGSDVQESLIAADPGQFFRPPYLGPKGWLGIWIDAEPDPDDIADYIVSSYRLIAPKRLVRDLDTATTPARRPETHPATPPE